jgi:hypothetical protein
LGTTKTVTIPREEDFSITLDDEGNDFVKYSIKNVSAVLNELTPTTDAEESKKRIVLSFKLNNNGFIELESASAVIEESFKTVDSKKKEKIEKKKKSLKLNFESEEINFSGLKKENFEESLKKFQEFEEYETEKRNIAKARNELESLLYHLKSEFKDEAATMKPFYTEKEKDSILKSVSDSSDWLDIQEDSTKLSEYQQRFNQLKTQSDPIFYRFKESQNRAVKLEFCSSTIKRMKDFVALMEQSFKHITQEERDNLLNLTSETEEFIKQKVEQQSKTPSNEAPVFTSDEIEKKCNALIEASAVLMRKPVPPPEPKPEETKPTEEKKSEEVPKTESPPKDQKTEL